MLWVYRSLLFQTASATSPLPLTTRSINLFAYPLFQLYFLTMAKTTSKGAKKATKAPKKAGGGSRKKRVKSYSSYIDLLGP